MLWADAMDVLRGFEPGSVDLYFTSPPYLLLRPKEYRGPATEREYIDWITPFAREMHRTLKDSGSLVLNLGLGPYLPGVPVRSAYVHRLILALLDEIGFHLAGEHFWHNPAALPAPAPWVTQQRRQTRDGVELLVWFSRTAWPKADNRRVLRPYSAAQRKMMERGWRPAIRPSGHDLTGNMAADNGGSIPDRLITVANTVSKDQYQRLCRERGIPVHPARFPAALPEFFIKLLTEPGDLVVDPFAGSLTTGRVAEDLGRRWVGVERAKAYVDGGLLRFSP